MEKNKRLFVLVLTFLGASLFFIAFIVYVYFSNVKLEKEFVSIQSTYEVAHDMEKNMFRLARLELLYKDYVLSGDTSTLASAQQLKSEIQAICTHANDMAAKLSDTLRDRLYLVTRNQTNQMQILESILDIRSYNSTEKTIAYRIKEANRKLNAEVNFDQMILKTLNEQLQKEYTTTYKDLVYSIRCLQLIGVISILLSAVILYVFVTYYKNISKSRLQLSELNDNKNKFFSIISHDLRGPVKNIALMAQFLTDKQTKSIDKDRIALLIESSSKNLSSLLDNLLKWSRLQMNTITFSPEKLNLQQVVEDVIRHQKVHAEQKNILIFNQVAHNKSIFVDQNMLSTVLRNILSNAIKFSHKGGKIEIQAQFYATKVDVSIQDYGVGIPSEILQQLFDLDFKHTTKGTNKEEGSGLGLKLCKEFIEKNGGNLYISSTVDKGTICMFTLPLSLVKD